MDKLTRETHEHGKILESMVFFEKFLKTITSNDTENYSAQLHQFSDEYIVQHFEFEEQEIFPLIRKKGSLDEIDFIEELQFDHEQILTSLAKFKEVISSYGPKPTKEQIKKIIRASEAVISQVILHARKEDKSLFPLLKKYQV